MNVQRSPAGVAPAEIKALIDGNADGILIVDGGGMIRFANPAALRLFRREAEDLLGSELGFPVVGGDMTEVELVRRGGEPCSLEMRAAPIEWQGRSAWVITLRDVTERRRAEERERELIRSEARRAEAERNAERAAFLASVGATVGESLDTRETLARLAKLVVPRLADAAFFHLLAEDGCLTLVSAVEASGDGGAAGTEAPSRELDDAASAFRIDPDKLMRPVETGRTIWSDELEPRPDAAGAAPAGDGDGLPGSPGGSFAIVPLRARGRALGAITLSVSASGRRLSREDLRLAEEVAARAALALENARLFTAEKRARQRAEAADHAKSEFLAVMSHELRTPLNAIIGYAELLQAGMEGPLSDGQRAKVERIEVSARHLAGIIDEILTLARAEAGTEKVTLEPLNLRTFVHETAGLIEPDADRKGLRLRTRVLTRTDVVEGDPGKLRQILLNLLGNAVKFTDEGEVELRVVEALNCIRFTVRDTGPGIPPEAHERIFEPFTQVDESRTRSQGGTGLGLPVSRRLARLMGGDVEVESVPGAGSTFTLELPFRRLQQPSSVVGEEPA